jgi:Ion channel
MRTKRLRRRRFPIRGPIKPRDNGLVQAIIPIVAIVVLSLPIWARDVLLSVHQVLHQLTELFPFLQYQFVRNVFDLQKIEIQLYSAPYFGFALVLLFAVISAINTVRALYKIRIRWGDQLVQSLSLFPSRRNTAGQIVFSAIASYALSVYAFGLMYFYIYSSKFTPEPFTTPVNDGVFTWVYFSIVTMATVGYGEIAPQTDWARAIVSAEILMGVAYQIFFFSIVASFVRERGRP